MAPRNKPPTGPCRLWACQTGVRVCCKRWADPYTGVRARREHSPAGLSFASRPARSRASAGLLEVELVDEHRRCEENGGHLFRHARWHEELECLLVGERVVTLVREEALDRAKLVILAVLVDVERHLAADDAALRRRARARAALELARAAVREAAAAARRLRGRARRRVAECARW